MTLARWQNSIEQIMLAAVGQQERILGLTSLRPGAGVSLVCHYIARTAAAGEFKTLLLDISEPQTRDAPVRSWRPGYDGISNLITSTVGRYDYLKVRTDEATRPLFSNPARLRSVYRTEFEQYALVIVDLPPLLEPTELGPNAVAAAGSCDQVLLVCAVGRDRRSELAEAISLVGGAGGRLAGLVSNEFLYEQPLDHMGRLASLLRGVPRVVARAPLVASRWTVMRVATAIASESAKAVDDVKALLRAAFWVVRLPVWALRCMATGIAAVGSWVWAKLVDAGKRLARATLWVALLPVRAARWIATGIAAAGSWMWVKLVGAAKRLIRATLWLALLPVRAMRWIATGIAAAGSWLWAKVVDAGKRLARVTLWLALLPVKAMRWIATGIAAAGSWMWAKLVDAAKLLIRATTWLALLPVRAMRWMATCVVMATAWAAAKLVHSAKALLAGARWLVHLPVAACRLIGASLLAAATKISDASLRFGRDALRMARHLWSLPSRLVGLLSRPAEKLHQSRAPDAGHRSVRDFQRAGALSVSLGGAVVIAMAALDLLGWSAEKGNRQIDASLGVTRPPMLRTAALDVTSYGGEFSASDVPTVSDSPASRIDEPPQTQAHTVAIDAPPAAPPNLGGQFEPAAAAPDESALPAPEPVRLAAVAISTPEPDDRLQRTSDNPSASSPLPDAMAPETAKAAPGEGSSVDTTSTPPPRESNDRQPESTAEVSATVAAAEVTPRIETLGLPKETTAPVPAFGPQSGTQADEPTASTAMVAGLPLPEPSAQQADHTSQPPASAEAPPASTADASPVLASAPSEPTTSSLSEPASEQTGQPLAPVASIVVALGPSSSPESVAASPNSGSLAPPAAPSDPTPQPAVQSTENPVLVAPGASPAVDASHASAAAEPNPASDHAGQATAAPITTAAAGVDAPVATVVTPPDSGSLALPPAVQVDQQADPAPKATTQSAENIAAVVPPQAPPAISSPTLTDKGAPTDTPTPARIPTLSAKERERAEQMVARGLRDLADGNVAQARLFFLNAAKAGLPRGALLLAASYDPRELSRPSILGVQPNIALARQWYERARELGAPEAAEQLAGLAGR